MITLKQLKYQMRKPEEQIFEMFRKMDGSLDLDRIIETVMIPDWFLDKFKNDLDWDKVCQYQHLTEETIVRFFSYINWDVVKKYQYLSESFISSYENSKHKFAAYE